MEINVGTRYNLKGKILNGYVDGQPFICDEHVTRVVVMVTDDKVYCECGRVFLKEGLKAEVD